MRILYVGMEHASYASRGHEVLVAEEMARLGHDVVLVTEQQPRWTPDSPQPKSLEYRSAPLNSPDSRIREAVARTLPGDFDAVFASSVSGAPLLADWRREHKDARAVRDRKVVVQVLDVPMWRLRAREAGPWFASWRPWVEALAVMDRVVVNTQQTLRDLGELQGLYGLKTALPAPEVVYYGIATEMCDAAPQRQLPIPEDAGGVPAAWAITVHRLVPYKGADLGIAALSLMEDDERPGFIIVGDGPEGQHLWDIASQSRTSVVLPGPVDDEMKFGLIKGAQVGLFLAFNQSIPAQFPLECVYGGAPCVVADLPINRERFGDHGVIYVDPFDTRMAAHGVHEALALRGSQRWRDGLERHREWIRSNRSFRSHAEGVLRVLGA